MEPESTNNQRQYYLDLIARSPKTPINKLSLFEKEHGHMQFGNNFYLLFSARLKRERDPEKSKKLAITQVYLDRIETKYPEQWQGFLENNRSIIRSIDNALDGLAPYEELLTYFITTRATGFNDVESQQMKSIGIYAWRRLNPLLKKASKLMNKSGISSKDFFG